MSVVLDPQTVQDFLAIFKKIERQVNKSSIDSIEIKKAEDLRFESLLFQLTQCNQKGLDQSFSLNTAQDTNVENQIKQLQERLSSHTKNQLTHMHINHNTMKRLRELYDQLSQLFRGDNVTSCLQQTNNQIHITLSSQQFLKPTLSLCRSYQLTIRCQFPAIDRKQSFLHASFFTIQQNTHVPFPQCNVTNFLPLK